VHKYVLRKYTLSLFTLAVCVITLLSNLRKTKENLSPGKLTESFMPELSYINSEEKLDYIVRAELSRSKNDTAHTLLFLHDLLKNRFYHSYSEFTWNQNWISLLCGKLVWSDFKFPVIPNDILKFPMASCSQQGLVFQNQLAKLNIRFSIISFYPNEKVNAGHYAVSAFYSKNWHFFDSNLEPTIADSSMPDINKIVDSGLYKKMYVSKSNAVLQTYFKNRYFTEKVYSKHLNGNMHYFHIITRFLSKWLWLILISITLSLSLRSRYRLAQVQTNSTK
jgi:hypothetical protein